MIGEAVLVVTVTGDREVAGEDIATVDRERYLAGVDLEADVFVHLDVGGPDAPVSRPATIVVARHQVLAANEVRDDWQGLGDAPERDVAEDPDLVIRSDRRVPVRDQRVVHLGDGGVRPWRVPDDVRVPQVQVRREEAHGGQR